MKRIKFWKRTICLSMAAIITTGMLTGCQSKAKNEETKNEVTKDEETEDVKDTASSSSTEEPTTLTVWSNWKISDQVKDQGDAAYWKAIEKACNVDLKFIDSTGGRDSLAILMGTDDLPDILIEFDADTNMPGGVQKALSDNLIIPLNDLMDSGKMPYFRAYLDSDEEADKLCVNDDGLYAWAPMIRRPDAPLVFNGNMIRQDWLDELGLEAPTTIQEMEDVLLAFKEEKGADTGYSFAYKSYRLMVMAYGLCEEMYVDNGEVKFGYIQPQYKDFLTLFNSWMEKGILDPDAFTQEIEAYYAKIATGRTGLVWGNTGGELGKIETMKEQDPSIDFQPIGNPVLKEGDTFPVDISNYRVNNVGAMISATCKEVDAAARVIDYVYGEEGNMLANYGELGKTYEMVDGKPVFTEYVTNNPDGLSIQQALSLYAGNNNKNFLLERDMQLQGYTLDVQKKSLDVWATPDSKIKQMPPLTFSLEETQEYNEIMTDIRTYAEEFRLKFIMGTEPLDNFDKFVENIKNMNITRAIEIQQAAYDRYLER